MHRIAVMVFSKKEEKHGVDASYIHYVHIGQVQKSYFMRQPKFF